MKLGFIARNDLEGLTEDARFARTHDFVGLEFNYWANFEDLTRETVEQMRERLDDHGVKCAALGLRGWNHIAPDAAERDRSLSHLERGIEFAQVLNARVLITGGGQIPDVSQEQQAAEFAKVVPPYVEQAGEADLLIALYAVHGNSFFQGIEDYERVWESVPDVGIKT